MVTEHHCDPACVLCGNNKPWPSDPAKRVCVRTGKPYDPKTCINCGKCGRKNSQKTMQVKPCGANSAQARGRQGENGKMLSESKENAHGF